MTNQTAAELNSILGINNPNKVNNNTNTQGENQMTANPNINKEVKKCVEGLPSKAAYLGSLITLGTIGAGGVPAATIAATGLLISPFVAELFPNSVSSALDIKYLAGTRIGNFEVDFNDPIEFWWGSIPNVKVDIWNINDIKAKAEAEAESVSTSIPNNEDEDSLALAEMMAAHASEKEEELAALYEGAEINNPNNSNAKVISVKYNTYSNINGVKTLDIIVDRNKESIKWNGSEFRINKYLIKVNKVRNAEGRQVDECQVITVNETINLIVKTLVARSKYPNKVLKLLSELKGTVLRSDWEINDNATSSDYNLGATVEATDLTVDNQQVLRDNSVVCFHVDHKGLMLSGAKYSWVEGCLGVSTAQWGFCVPDKTNSKRAFIKDAVIVVGRSADGTKSIVKDSKETKQLTREASAKHIAAQIPNGSEPDNLVAVLSDGRYGVSYGFKETSLLINDPLMSASNGDGQIITRKPIASIVNKRLTSSVNIDGLFANNPEFVALVAKKRVSRGGQVDALIPMIKEAIAARQLNNPTLKAGEALVFEGQALINNNNVFPVNIISAYVKSGGVLNTECRTIDIETHCQAEFEDHNAKLRGQWIKGMTGKADGYQVEGCEANLILNHNSIKNEKGVALRAWANAKGVVIGWNAQGELRYIDSEGTLGELVNLEQVESEITLMTKSYKVVNVISKEDYDTFFNANPEAFSHVLDTKVDGEIVTLTYMADGIEAPMVYAIELSSVQENLSLNRRVSPDRVSFLTTFGMSHVQEQLDARMKQIIKNMEDAKAPFTGVVFDANEGSDRTKLVEILTNRTKLPARSLFKALAEVFPNGIRIKASTNEGTRKCEATINPQLLFCLGGFRNDGSSHNTTVNEVSLLLGFLADKKSSINKIVDYVMKLGKALDGWVEDITTQDKAFTKGNALFHTHGMKVLSASVVKDEAGNYLPSYEEITHEGRTVRAYILWINSENPLAIAGTKDKLGNKVKPLASGDVVFGFRNPVLDVIPMIIRFNDNTCDKFTCAVSPSVLAWSSQTDNDGDTFWVIPAKQFRVANVEHELLSSGREALVDLLPKHPLVNKNLALETMKTFGCGDLFAGIIKSRSNFNVIHRVKGEVTTVIGESNPNNLELAEAVAKHYKQRVGQGYAMMFNAYSSFVRKFHQTGDFSQFSEAELQGIKACSFVFYEDAGLSGYSVENEAKFAKVNNIAKRQLGVIKAKARSPFGPKEDTLETEAWGYAANFRAQGIIQSGLERGEIKVSTANVGKAKVEALIDEAAINGLFRTLTKGYLNYQGDDISGIFNLTKNFTVDINMPYAPALNAWKSFVGSSFIASNVG